MAVDTMEAAIKARGLKPARECQTDGLFLEGGEGFTENFFIRLVQDFGLEVEVCLSTGNPHSVHGRCTYQWKASSWLLQGRKQAEAGICLL